MASFQDRLKQLDSVFSTGHGTGSSIPTSETFHSFLCIETSKPLEEYPTNYRVLYQTSAVVPKVSVQNETRSSELVDKAISDVTQWIQKQYGEKFTLETNEDIEKSADWKVEFSNQSSTSVNTTVFIRHNVVERKVAQTKKISEALSKIEYSCQRQQDTVRLDYLNLDEDTMPSQVYKLAVTNPKLSRLQLSFNNFSRLPTMVLQVFDQIRSLNLSGCKCLYTLPDDIHKLTQLEELNLVDCQNLLSLPKSLSKLQHTLEKLDLYGCTMLAYPPHEICLKVGMARQQGGSKAGVDALLMYIENPESFRNFDFEKFKNYRNHQHNDMQLQVTVPSTRVAFGKNYVEYELNVIVGYKRWNLYRRFSQLKEFHDQMMKIVPNSQVLPRFPSTCWRLHSTDEETVNMRRVMLDAYTRALCDNKTLSLPLSLISYDMVRTFFEIDQYIENIDKLIKDSNDNHQHKIVGNENTSNIQSSSIIGGLGSLLMMPFSLTPLRRNSSPASIEPDTKDKNDMTEEKQYNHTKANESNHQGDNMILQRTRSISNPVTYPTAHAAVIKRPPPLPHITNNIPENRNIKKLPPPLPTHVKPMISNQ